jgi:hypothetical protein
LRYTSKDGKAKFLNSAFMKVFLSWSGHGSKQAAYALEVWLKRVFPEISIWMSASSIEAGSKWAAELDRELSTTNFGILCLCPDNLISPWVLFEAGALSKSVDDRITKVIPFCMKLNPSELNGPLSQFQSVSADKEGTFSLIKSINSQLVNRRSNEDLNITFETWWPQLRSELEKVMVISTAGIQYINVNNILCGVTTEFSSRGGDKDIKILKDNFPDKVKVIEGMSLKTLRQALSSRKYEIVHLVGFVDNDNGDFIFSDTEKVKTEGLLELLQQSETSLAVLATCDSLVLGAALSRDMNVVSGYSNIAVDTIVKWAECFYELLAQGNSLTKTFDIARTTAFAPMMILAKNDMIFIK